MMVGSHGVLAVISPYTGEIKQQLSVKSDIYLPPVIANNTLYLLSDNATLISIR